MSYHAANRSSARFKILKHQLEVNPPVLTQEIERRKLDLELCRKHFKQLYLLDRRNNQTSYAFGFSNVNGGNQIVIPNHERPACYKGVVGRKGFTFLKGEFPSNIDVFRSYWCYLTWLTVTKRTQPKFDTYIINGFENVPDTIRHMEQRKDSINSIMDFFPNNPSGEFTRELLQEFSEQNSIEYGAQNYLYSGYVDLSNFWMNSEDAPRLSKIIYQ